MKSILDKDREMRGIGGHSSKIQFAMNLKIDKENEKILKSIKQQRASINFKKLKNDFVETSRIKKNMSLFPSIK